MPYMFLHALRVMSILRCVEGCNDMKEYILRCHATYLTLRLEASLSVIEDGRASIPLMDILPPSFTDIGHPLVCGWGMMQLSLTHFCALVFPLLTVGASLSVLGLGCCRLGTFTFLCPQKFPLSRWWASFPMYVKRMWRFCGWLISCNHFSTFRYGASSYISMGMLAF